MKVTLNPKLTFGAVEVAAPFQVVGLFVQEDARDKERLGWYLDWLQNPETNAGTIGGNAGYLERKRDGIEVGHDYAGLEPVTVPVEDMIWLLETWRDALESGKNVGAELTSPSEG